ncbi:hypothetical protein SEMRO_2008_G310670.1 [Seminavis robusta]|uniref:Uncharacterized protein n=1 Tax=Seminavis robusta TaxID=568900 RepID=A0A9N8HVM0_9STRA|nr:hypothetical protein SEMRO_2008_G310670.1 [Seminavis robusta]|eukprot:Sro2008_g310670.1 n/a (124) ;mRNA; r:18474-18845
MTILAESPARSTHAKLDSSWETAIMSVGGDDQTKVAWSITYIDLDGNETTQYFQRLEDTRVYSETIKLVWELIDKANGCEKTTKNFCYQEILTLMEGQVATFGAGYLLHYLKTAINEIKEYFA